MPDVSLLIAHIMASGAFGGFVFGLFTRNSYKIRLPLTGNLLEVGFIGDLLVGIGASMTVFFLAGSMFGLKFEGALTAETYIKVIALGVLAGFAGIRLLAGMSNRLLDQISELDSRLDRVEKQDKISELLRQAEFLRNNNPERSLIIFEKALLIDPENEPALIGKAKALRRLNRFDEAISILTQVIQRNPKAERAYYNRACYKNLSGGYTKDDVLADLKTAASLFGFYRDYALDDKDFQSLHEDADFRQIVKQKNGSH